MALTQKEIKQRYFDKVYAEAPLVECACGCGEQIKSKDRYGRDKRFVSGHNGRKYEDPKEYKRAYVKRKRILSETPAERPPKRRWTDSELDYLRNVYPKVGWKRASVELGRSGEAVMSMAKRHGITSLVHDKLKNQTRAANSVNLTYFDRMKGYEKGYVLGFLLADGSSNGINAVTVEIRDYDVEVLEFISEQMKLTASITPRKKRPMVAVSIPTKRMNTRLRTLGVVPDKSAIVRFPDGGDEEFNRGVVAGYFDGDGSVGWWAGEFGVNFSSNSRPMLESLSKIISEATGLGQNGVFGNKLSYKGGSAITVCEWMYEGLSSGEFHMRRKAAIYLEERGEHVRDHQGENPDQDVDPSP